MRLPLSLETTCFRVAQIALTNALRHGHAKHIKVTLRKHISTVDLAISDDGVGFDVNAALEHASRGGTLGLLSMQERVRLAQGALTIDSEPGHGTIISARFVLES